jgi:DNA primase
MPRLPRYSSFVDRIDLDALYEALEWEPIRSDKDEDIGYCLDTHGLHKHGDTTGKLAISRTKKVYNCWVCGGGSLLKLAMETQNLGEEAATEWLHQFASSEQITEARIKDRLESILTVEKADPKPMPYYNERVLEQWLGDQRQAYYAYRHISQEVLDYFKCGLKYQDRTYALVLPHYWDKRLVGWQSRWLGSNRTKPKYENTPDFPRYNTLWGYHFAMEQTEAPIVVESVLTALYLISEGYPAIATFGAQLTDQQLKLLRVFQAGVQLAPDNDNPGIVWRDRATRYLKRYIPVLHVPPVGIAGDDLGDLKPEFLSTHLCDVTLA